MHYIAVLFSIAGDTGSPVYPRVIRVLGGHSGYAGRDVRLWYTVLYVHHSRHLGLHLWGPHLCAPLLPTQTHQLI